MKWRVFALLALLVLAGCSSGTTERFSCQSDKDCVPLPTQCHTRTCINKAYAEPLSKPLVCSKIFMLEAAYNPEDCVCINHVCTNKNLGRTNPSTTPSEGNESALASPKPNGSLSIEKCEAEGGRITTTHCNGRIIGLVNGQGCCIPETGLKRALEIAERSECAMSGTLTGDDFYNNLTHTWWLGFLPKENKPGCNPACVVSIETGKAEINWRCTGLREGLCVNRCGDGNCAEVVCMGSGCPCPESAETCPQDCH